MLQAKWITLLGATLLPDVPCNGSQWQGSPAELRTAYSLETQTVFVGHTLPSVRNVLLSVVQSSQMLCGRARRAVVMREVDASLMRHVGQRHMRWAVPQLWDLCVLEF